MNAPPLTAAEARALFSYDPASGILRWRVSRGRARAGARAGTVAWCATGENRRQRLVYRWRQVSVARRIYKEHKLIWLIVTGEWPSHEVDHRDTDATNNRWRNLRGSTSSQNKSNARVSPRNKSGLKWVRTMGPRRFQATVNGVYLGTFKTARAAHERAAIYARKAYGEFFNDGRAPSVSPGARL